MNSRVVEIPRVRFTINSEGSRDAEDEPERGDELPLEGRDSLS
jgi:hypothetical protein